MSHNLDPRRFLPPIHLQQLDNGLTLCLLHNHLSPVVATALIYRVGTRDESELEAGAAHFLEHMMFKGSERYGPGDIDRLTQSLGGSNNAYTSHDATLYYFTFAADRWQQALSIEADRMAGLRLDAEEVDSERQVIFEEIAMYEGDPWDALDQQVAAALYGEHPYGRPVLGTATSLTKIDSAALRSFHRRHYRPDNAVLVVAGDIDATAREAIEEHFGGLRGSQPGGGQEGPAVGQSGAAPGRRPVPPRPRVDDGPRRISRRQGDVARMILSLPIAAGSSPEHPLLALLVGLLGTGRSSRLHRILVDEGQLCAWVSAELQETLEPGQIQIALEVMPGVEPQRVEDRLLQELDTLRRHGPTADEVARARRVILADWVFAHDRVHQQAFFAATAVALFNPEHPWTYFERLQKATLEDLRQLAERRLVPAAGVIGWSLPSLLVGQGLAPELERGEVSHASA